MEEFLHVYNDFGKQKKKNKLHKSYQDVNLSFIFNYTTFNSRLWPIFSICTIEVLTDSQVGYYDAKVSFS